MRRDDSEIYAFIAVIADHYGPHFIRFLRHPAQYWGWLAAVRGSHLRIDHGRNCSQQTAGGNNKCVKLVAVQVLKKVLTLPALSER